MSNFASCLSSSDGFLSNDFNFGLNIKQDLKDKEEEDYIKMLDYFIQNYEIILYNQRIRKQKKIEINIEDNKNH